MLNSLLDHFTPEATIAGHFALLKLQAGFELVKLESYTYAEEHLYPVYNYINLKEISESAFLPLYAELCLNLYKCALVSGKFDEADKLIRSIHNTAPNALEAYLCAAEFALEKFPDFGHIQVYASAVFDAFRNLVEKATHKLWLRALLVYLHSKGQLAMDGVSAEIIRYGTEALDLLAASNKELEDEKFAFSLIDLFCLLAHAFSSEKRLNEASEHLERGYEIVTKLLDQDFKLYSKVYIDFVTHYAGFLSDNRRPDAALSILLTCTDKLHFANDGTESARRSLLTFHLLLTQVCQTLDQRLMARIYLIDAMNLMIKGAPYSRYMRGLFIETIDQLAKFDAFLENKATALTRYEFAEIIINQVAKPEDQLHYWEAKITFGKYFYSLDTRMQTTTLHAFKIIALYCDCFRFQSRFAGSSSNARTNFYGTQKNWTFLPEIVKYLVRISGEEKNYRQVFELYLVLLNQQSFLDLTNLLDKDIVFDTHLEAAEAAIRISNQKFAILQFVECEKLLDTYPYGHKNVAKYRQTVFRVCEIYGLEKDYIIAEINRILYSPQLEGVLV